MSRILISAEPCPWCASAKLWVWDKAVPGGWAVACSNPDCAATGPISRVSEADAVILWNMAPRIAPSPGFRRASEEMQLPEPAER